MTAQLHGFEQDSSPPAHRSMFLGGDYVFVDQTEDFTGLGKWSTFALTAIVWILLFLTPSNRQRRSTFILSRPVIALCGSLVMIIWRNLLVSFEQGPYFNVRRAILLEPLLFFATSQLLSVTLKETLRKVSIRQTISAMAWTVGLSALWIQDSFMDSVLDFCATASHPVITLFSLTWTATIGSALTVTGSMSNVVVATLAYDDIGWLEFVKNMALPVVASLVVVHMFAFSMRFLVVHTDILDPVPESSGYSGIPVEPTTTDDNPSAEEKKEERSEGLYELNYPQPEANKAGKRAAFSVETGSVKEDEESFTMPDIDDEDEDETRFTLRCAVGLAVSVFFLLLALLFFVLGSKEAATIFLGIGVLVLSITALVTSRATMKAYVVLVMVAFLCAGFNVFVVTLTAGATLMIVDNRSRLKRRTSDVERGVVNADETTEPDQRDNYDLFRELDWGLLVYYASQFVLTSSLNDTGIPAAFFNTAMGGCTDDFVRSHEDCLYRFSAVFVALCAVVSPVPATIMFGATVPYASPYEWIQVAWVASVASNVSVFGKTIVENAAGRGLHPIDWPKLAFLGVPCTMVCLFAGVFLIEHIHFSPECSVRLGECSGS